MVNAAQIVGTAPTAISNYQYGPACVSIIHGLTLLRRTILFVTTPAREKRAMMRRWLKIFLLVVPLTGCSAQQNIQEDAETVVILPANQKTAYVTTPVDGRDGAKIYFRSGVLTAMIVADAFAPYFINLTLGSSQETRDEALASARSQQADYLIEPKILRWRDVDTAWTGVVDQATVTVSIIETNSGTMIKSGTIDAKGSFMGIAAGHPEDFLEKPIRQYAESLFSQ
ncbi:MAG: hypothetical protein CMM78_09605 [Rhodospirillaceae bacterium]|jgi:hypothetical protein|uniref:DUF4823 domain-containing protein n=1 Tax=Hwanghaeella sp. 1Z406 TaxID=3402811 RepID=UPI000C54C6EF|nr:hypothetical protein [Rhodospirillales bacterium]MAO91747.1 hypothetical protein [Rhodospirillales bacterium]MAX48450.1 hypothetical protein [Rhodospirillaceae bacterium]|tara:strand:- start:364 stop:1044 length:681 start_codon:yes stop_codon:yes gene_type:complete